METKNIKFIDFDRQIAFLEESDLICDVSRVYFEANGQKVQTYTPRVGDNIIVPRQEITENRMVSGIRPSQVTKKSGSITFWDRKRETGWLNGNIAFNISDCLNWTPRVNEEVFFLQIPNRKGPRAIEVEKFRGTAAGRTRIAPVSRNDQRRFIFKGPRPQVLKRRDASPQFLPNFDVPTALVNGIRGGTDILKIVPSLTLDLNEKNYQDKMTALLFCEEVALGIEMEQFSLKDVVLEHLSCNHFSLEIPGLKNESPPLGIADLLIITVKGNDTMEFHAFIHTIRFTASTVLFEMSDVFTEKHKASPVTIKFTLNRYPIRTMQNALKGIGRDLSLVTLFPTPTNFFGLEDRRRFEYIQPYHVTASMISGLNQFQNDAVLSVLEGAGMFHPKIIFGPAGTGKTRTMVELARILITCSTARVLIVAPSNAAADILLSRLSNALGERAERIICRWNALRRNNETLSENCKKFSKDDFAKEARCVISTCLATSSLPRRKFDFLLVDEASQCTEPETLVAMRFTLPGSQVILAGDPAQLGPTVKSPYSCHFGLTTSLLMRLMGNSLYEKQSTGQYDRLYLTKLLINYRSHPSLLEITSNLFYERELMPADNEHFDGTLDKYADFLPKPGFPFILVDVASGTEARQTGSFSWFNAREAVQVLSYCKNVIKAGLAQSDVGIISPYRQQVVEIRKILKLSNLNDIRVGSTEEFQGTEYKCIIISTVRANERLLEYDARTCIGFVASKQRTCVALTRAKELIILIGKLELLELDSTWKEFITHCRAHSAIITA